MIMVWDTIGPHAAREKRARKKKAWNLHILLSEIGRLAARAEILVRTELAAKRKYVPVFQVRVLYAGEKKQLLIRQKDAQPCVNLPGLFPSLVADSPAQFIQRDLLWPSREVQDVRTLTLADWREESRYSVVEIPSGPSAPFEW